MKLFDFCFCFNSLNGASDINIEIDVDAFVRGFNSLNGASDIADQHLFSDALHLFQFLKWCEWYLIESDSFDISEGFNSLNGASDMERLWQVMVTTAMVSIP